MGMDKYKQVGSSNDVSTLNQNEQGMRQDSLKGIQNLQMNYDNILKSMTSAQMQGLLGNISSAGQGYGNIGQGITDAASAFGNINTNRLDQVSANYNPYAANNALMASMPGYINAAQGAANSALSGTNQSAQQLAQLATNDAMRNSSAQMANSGLLTSGAGMQSMFESALTPQQQLQTDLAKMQSQYSGNVLGTLMGSGANLFGQGYETQNANNMAGANADWQNQIGAAQARLQGATSQLNVKNSDVSAQQQIYDSQLKNLMAQIQGIQAQSGDLSNMANLTQQQYYTPQYAKKASWLDYANTAVGAASAIGSLATGMPNIKEFFKGK